MVTWIGFLYEFYVRRPVDDPFWSLVDVITDSDDVEHWVPSVRIYHGRAAHRYAWRDLTSELNLDDLSRARYLRATCAQPGCVHPAHRRVTSSSRGLPAPLVFPERINDPFYSRIVFDPDPGSGDHWLFLGDSVPAARARVWIDEGPPDQEPLADDERLYRRCEVTQCVNPAHTCRDIETWQSDRRERRAVRYRTDPAFRARVRAHFAEQAQRRAQRARERSNASPDPAARAVE